MALTDTVWLCSNKQCKYAWYVKNGEKPNDTGICRKCGSEIIKTPLIVEEYVYITLISEDRDFIDAMIELKQKDIIEFKTKIAQFKAQVDTEEERKRQSNVPKCPTCCSTNIEKISAGKKMSGAFLFGIFSSDIRNTMHCKDCGAKW